MTFNIAWARFCYLAPLFKHRLSDILIEERDGLVFLIPPSRIKIINIEKECEFKHGNVKIAVVDFYISTHVDPNKVDKKYTEQAFAILFHFWEAKRMVLLGPTFEQMVDNVEIRGEEAHKFPKRLNEGERIGIGIAVGLIIVFALTAIYIFMYVYHKGRTSKTMKLEAPRMYGKALNRRDSLTSKGTEDTLDENVEMMKLAEPRMNACVEMAPAYKVEEEADKDEDEKELDYFVAKM